MTKQQISEKEIIRMTNAIRSNVLLAMGNKALSAGNMLEFVVRTLAEIVNEQNRPDATWKRHKKGVE